MAKTANGISEVMPAPTVAVDRARPVAGGIDHLALSVGHRSPRLGERRRVLPELDRLIVVEEGVENLAGLGRCRFVARAAAQFDPGVLLADRQNVVGGMAGEPGADRIVREALRQQHVAEPRVDPCRWDELGGRQFIHAIVWDQPHSRQRRHLSLARWRGDGTRFVGSFRRRRRWRQRRPEGGIGGTAGEHLVAAAAPRPGVHAGGGRGPEHCVDGCQQPTAVRLRVGLGWERDVDHREPPDDRPTDGDPVARLERGDDGAVHVTVTHQLAAA